MSKVIVINGSGLGKTYIGKLLEEEYKKQGIACKRYQISSRLEAEEIETLNNFIGYIIIETNQTTIKGISPWQSIEVTGGR